MTETADPAVDTLSAEANLAALIESGQTATCPLLPADDQTLATITRGVDGFDGTLTPSVSLSDSSVTCSSTQPGGMTITVWSDWEGALTAGYTDPQELADAWGG